MMKLIANMHGNEAVGRELMLALSAYLLENFNTDQRVRDIVSKTDIHIMPSLNPDGRLLLLKHQDIMVLTKGLKTVLWESVVVTTLVQEDTMATTLTLTELSPPGTMSASARMSCWKGANQRWPQWLTGFLVSHLFCLQTFMTGRWSSTTLMMTVIFPLDRR